MSDSVRTEFRPATESRAGSPPAAEGDPLKTTPLTADLDLLAQWMDAAVGVPGTGVRFGFDAVLGLVPGFGDVATTLVSAYILRRAHHLGASRATMLRMSANIALDLIVGAIPLVGDAFDLYWKANLRNVELLRRHALAPPERARRMAWADGLFVGALLAGLAAILVASVVGAYFIVTWLAGAVGLTAG